MMNPVFRVDGRFGSAEAGRPQFDMAKAAWNGSLLLITLTLAPIFISWSAFFVFAVMTYALLLLGHSVGMHRMMIHRTFKCSKPIERTLIYLGVLVGVAGPFGTLRIHDIRDWAQRQSQCHDFFAHRCGYFQDLLWQLAYRFEFDQPPILNVEENLQHDSWYQFFERTWRWHQLVLAIPLYLLGGLSWVVWGVCVRVFVSVAGHWTVTHFCHRPGPGSWTVKKASVQASNLPSLGILTCGECWHNNHHAFPESARIGLEKDQADPSWWVIALMSRLGIVKDVGLPRPLPEQEDIESRTNGSRCTIESRERAALEIGERL